MSARKREIERAPIVEAAMRYIEMGRNNGGWESL